jgi:hypothetical protein
MNLKKMKNKKQKEDPSLNEFLLRSFIKNHKPDLIEQKVLNYKTKHEEGFMDSEVEELLKEFPEINMEMFNEALWGNTCMVIDEKIINYHCDIIKALRCGVENRKLRFEEWD